MVPEFQHVRSVLIETIALLCKNSLQYEHNINIQGLIGITLDDEEILLVHVNEVVRKVKAVAATSSYDEGLVTDSEGEKIPGAKIESATNRSLHAKRPHKSKKRRIESICNDARETNAEDARCISPEVNKKQIIETASQISPILMQESSTAILYTDIKTEPPSDIEISHNSTRRIISPANLLRRRDAGILQSYSHGAKYDYFNNASSVVGGDSYPHLEYGDRREAVFKQGSNARLRNQDGLTIHTDECASNRLEDVFHMNAPYLGERRSALATQEKTFICDYESCSKAYYARKNLLRHQTTAHGRMPCWHRGGGRHAVTTEFMYDNNASTSEFESDRIESSPSLQMSFK